MSIRNCEWAKWHRRYQVYLNGLCNKAIAEGRDMLEQWLAEPDRVYGSDRDAMSKDLVRLAWHNAELCRRRDWQTPAGNWVDCVEVETWAARAEANRALSNGGQACTGM